MADKNTGIAAKLLALRNNYSERLTRDLATLKTLVAEAARAEHCGTTQERLLAAAYQILHQFAGSAGSFGFEELGTRARQLAQQMQIPDRESLCALALAVAALEGLVRPDPLVLALPSLPLAKAAVRQAHIYILEADAHMAEELGLTLRHFGHRVTRFSDLETAAASIAKERPDLLVVDMQLRAGGRESPQFIADLQRQLAQPLPVIFISSRRDFAACHAAIKAGAVGYFVKPLDMIRLANRLEKHLDRRSELAYRVLIIDDDLTSSDRCRRVLMAAGMRVEVIANPELVFISLRDFSPELILLNPDIPACPGAELARVIRLCDEWSRVPITCLSSGTRSSGTRSSGTRSSATGSGTGTDPVPSSGTGTDTQGTDTLQCAGAMEQGEDDVIPGSVSDSELVAAVSLRAARSRQLCNAMDRDTLTGLLQHSRIKEQIETDLARAQRTGEWLSLAMIDLDHFKSVNETYGHAAGDKVIKALAQLLRQRLRKTDSIGRYGGEEFVAVLPGCSALQAQRLLNEVRENFKQIGFNLDDKHFTVTLSAGVASMEATRVINAEAFLQMADDVLYLAKHGGCDQVRVA